MPIINELRSSRQIGILGSGDLANSVANMAVRSGKEVVFFADSEPASAPRYMLWDGSIPKVIDIIQSIEAYHDIPVIAAAGAPEIRRTLVGLWPSNNYGAVVDPESLAIIHPEQQIGAGTIILGGVHIEWVNQVGEYREKGAQPVEIGSHVLLNRVGHIPHGSRLGDFASVMAGVNLGGDVIVGPGAFIGQGAVIRPGLELPEGVLIGQGSNVVDTNHAEVNATAVNSGGKAVWLPVDRNTWPRDIR